MTMSEELTCARCGGSLEEGYIPEQGDMNYGLGPSEWVEGQPKISFWAGLDTDGREKFKVEAFRCASCGRLELFARESA
jgi:hypothetical protein